MKLCELLALLRSNVSGERAVKTAAAYRQFPLQLGFSSYNSGISWLCRQYESLGLSAEKIDFPADGKTTYGDRHFPLAWDIEDGWLKVQSSEFRVSPSGQATTWPASDRRGTDTTLASYKEDPYGIVPFSADSNGEHSAVIIPAAELRKGVPGRKPADIVILFDQYPGYDDIQWAIKTGYKALAACVGVDSSNSIINKSRKWFNAMFDAGQIDARSVTLCAYSLPPVDVVALLEYFKRCGPIPVKYLMRTKTYAGTVSAASACLKGASGDDRSFMIAAHAYEPNATNNVSGVAICMETAAILSDLIRKGALPKPRRSIRFFHGLEVFSLYAYALQNPERFKKIMFGLTIDGVGAGDHDQVKEKIFLLRCAEIHPSFWHYLSEKILSESVRHMGLSYETAENGFSSNDDMVNDPMFGPAWNMIYGSQWFKTGFYHVNTDTADRLSPERMAELAVFAAASAYTVSNADGSDALDFAKIACDGAIRQYAGNNTRLMDGISENNDEIKEKGIALRFYNGTAVPSSMASIESAIQLVPETERENIQPQISGLSRQFQKSAEGITEALLNSLAAALEGEAQKLFKPGNTEAEKKAASMIPVRRLPGILSLGAQSRETRVEASQFAGYYANEYWNFMAPLYYWFDGKRTLLEAAMAHYTATNLGEPAKAGVLPAFTNSAPDAKSRIPMIEKFNALAEFLEKHGYINMVRNQRPLVTKQIIIEGLKKIGIQSGDVVIVHSSLSQFGEVRGGADTVIDALMDVIGNEGILAMPAFTFVTDGSKIPAFDPSTSKVDSSIGIICDTFWQRKDVLRSSHPTHSVAARGKRAEDFLRSENSNDTFDWNGPWGKLFKWNGKVLSFGETFGAITYLHALEAWFLPYLDKAYARVKEGNGEKLFFISNYPDGCRGGWYKLRRNAPHYKRLSERGLYNETKIGAAAAMVINVRDLTREMHALFKQDPAVFLHKSGCLPCAERRAKLVGWKIPDCPPDNT